MIISIICKDCMYYNGQCERGWRGCEFAPRKTLPNTSPLGAHILAYRIKHALTQSDFAQLAGISRCTVNRIERGRATNLQGATLAKIISIIGEQDGQNT